MEFLEQRLRLELQESAGKSQACLRAGVGGLPANLPLCAGSGPRLRSSIHLVPHKRTCCGTARYSNPSPGVICSSSPFLHLR